MIATTRPRDRARPDGHGHEGLRHHGMTRQVRPGNEGPRARYPRPDTLLTTEGLALGEHRIRTGDGPGRGTHSHLSSPPPERVERLNPTYSRCTVHDVSSIDLLKSSAAGDPWFPLRGVFASLRQRLPFAEVARTAHAQSGPNSTCHGRSSLSSSSLGRPSHSTAGSISVPQLATPAAHVTIPGPLPGWPEWVENPGGVPLVCAAFPQTILLQAAALCVL